MSTPRPRIPNAVICDVLDTFRALELSECNGNFQELVVSRIFETGKPVEKMTLGELVSLIETARHDFNRDYEAARVRLARLAMQPEKETMDSKPNEPTPGPENNPPPVCQHYNNQFGTRCGKPATHFAFGFQNGAKLPLCDEHAETYRGFGKPVEVRPVNHSFKVETDAAPPAAETPTPAPETPPENTASDEQGISPGV